MDPLATLAIINDMSEDADMRFSHLHYLADWMAKGGGIPFGERLTHETLVFAEDSGMIQLAAAVNVALVNADMSGLVGCGYHVQR
jgi:hypothetical protein